MPPKIKAYKLYEVSDGVMGIDIIRGQFLSMPDAILAWDRAFSGLYADAGGDSYSKEDRGMVIVCEALNDGTYGPPYATSPWEDGEKPSVYPMKGTSDE